MTAADHERKIRELERENDALRGIASKIMPCHYCGAEEIARCPKGFPGCALMDDVMGMEEGVMEALREARAEIERLREALAEISRATTDGWAERIADEALAAAQPPGEEQP